MKRLITNESDFFFDATVSNVQICRFVNENLNLFFLNEEQSCSATLLGNTICISGGKDNLEIKIEIIKNSSN